LYRSPDIITSIRIYRLRWAVHVERMSGEYILRRIMDCKPEGRRRIGRPKLRWVDGVLHNMKKVGVKNWCTVSKDKEAWNRFFGKPIATLGCKATDGGGGDDDNDDDDYFV
jgi:hypothetical protein